MQFSTILKERYSFQLRQLDEHIENILSSVYSSMAMLTVLNYTCVFLHDELFLNRIHSKFRMKIFCEFIQNIA